jgi:hypothetical protein
VSEVVIDTNVWAVADERHDQVCLECIETCQQFLRTLQTHRVLAVDDAHQVLNEYRRNIDPGGYFAKLLNQLQQQSLIQFVSLSRGEDDPLFGDGGQLQSFDPPDRKFVLLALESEPHRPIYDAVDPDWSVYSRGLGELGVTVHELCPCDLARFL